MFDARPAGADLSPETALFVPGRRRTVRMKINVKTLGLIVAILAGLVFPQLHSLTGAVRYLIMAMLFLAFINLRIERRSFHRSHLYLLLLAPCIAAVSYFAILPFDREIAVVALLVAMTPTATASPVVTSLIGGSASYAALSVLATSMAQPFLLSLALPFLAHGARFSMLDTIVPVLVTIGAPFLAARLLMFAAPSLSMRFNRLKPMSFFLWLAVLVIACAQASFYLHHADSSKSRIIAVALISFALCCINFTLGRMAGGKEHAIEAGQSLGQKNTVFSIWVALTFLSPFAVTGPAFYIIWHNLWNARQIHLYSIKKSKTD